MMKVIKDKLYVDRMTMVSGLGQQASIPLWDYVLEADAEDSVYWFWPSQHDEPGAMVHVGGIYAGKRSDGYGGRTLDFPTKDGVIKIQGPWHSNTDALYERTGVDLRDKHRTIGVIALRRGMEGNDSVLLDVVYADPDGGLVGTFDRIRDLAEKMATEANTVLFYYRKSSSGSSCGPVYPTGWTENQKRDYFNPQMES